jgi:hypothetical protein
MRRSRSRLNAHDDADGARVRAALHQERGQGTCAGGRLAGATSPDGGLSSADAVSTAGLHLYDFLTRRRPCAGMAKKPVVGCSGPTRSFWTVHQSTSATPTIDIRK